MGGSKRLGTKILVSFGFLMILGRIPAPTKMWEGSPTGAKIRNRGWGACPLYRIGRGHAPPRKIIGGGGKKHRKNRKISSA